MSESEDNLRFDAPPENDGNDGSGAYPNSQNRALVPAEPLHRMHEGRVVRSAGQMLVGSPVPVPTLDDILNDTPVFSGRQKRSWQISSGFAVALTCLVAVGAAVTLTHFLNKNRRTESAAQRPSQQSSHRTVNNGEQSGGGEITSRKGAALPVQTVVNGAGNLTVKDIAGPPGVPLRLPISVANASPEEYSFLMLRNLPAEISVSAGFRLKDAWAVSLRDLDGLTLQTPLDYSGSFQLEVLLIKGKDLPTEVRQFSVAIQSLDAGRVQVAGPIPGAAVGNAAEPGGVETATRTETDIQADLRTSPHVALATPVESTPPKPLSAAEEAAIMEKAERFLHNFDLISARLLLEYLARRGSSKGAFSLAESYDPAFFDSTRNRGMRAEANKAREWYTKAANLGNEEATARLRVLAAR